MLIWLLEFGDQKGIRLVPDCQFTFQDAATSRQLCHKCYRPLWRSRPSADDFFIQCSPHGEHQWSICSWLLPTESCLYSHHHSRAWGPSTSMWCQCHGVCLPTIQDAAGCPQQDPQFSQHDGDLVSSTPDVSIMDARATPAVLLSSHTTGQASTSHSRSSVARTSHYWPSNLHIWLLWRICLSSLVTAGVLQNAWVPIWGHPPLVAMNRIGVDS